jgi:hypothetical protein
MKLCVRQCRQAVGLLAHTALARRHLSARPGAELSPDPGSLRLLPAVDRIADVDEGAGRQGVALCGRRHRLRAYPRGRPDGDLAHAQRRPCNPGRSDRIHADLPPLRVSIGRADADRCLPVLLHLQGLRRDAQTLAGRLLCVLFLRHGGVSVGTDGAALRVSGVGSSTTSRHGPWGGESECLPAPRY